MQRSAGPDRQIIRREGEYWTIVYAGETCRLKDTKGLSYLSHLLRRPQQPVLALEFEGAAARRSAGGERIDGRARERARVNVTRTLSLTLVRIAAHHPKLATHLKATLRTGGSCTYTPDPRVPAVWES
jgi:hypothetical protein